MASTEQRVRPGVVVQQGAITQGQDGNSNIKMFSDIHRYLMQRHADIEWLRSQHLRKDKQRKDAINECQRSLEHDTAERIAQIAKFSEEMQRHTNRKVEVLQKAIAEQEVVYKKCDCTLQSQIDRVVRELDSMHYGFCGVTEAMECLTGATAPADAAAKATMPAEAAATSETSRKAEAKSA